MTAPCGRTGGHRHRVSWAVSGRKREWLVDRCNSGLLWSTVARAVVKGADPLLDGQPVPWSKGAAWAYLLKQHPKWRQGLVDPAAVVEPQPGPGVPVAGSDEEWLAGADHEAAR